MQRITVDEVMDAVQRILEGSTDGRPQKALDASFFCDLDANPLGFIVRGSFAAAGSRRCDTLVTTPRPSEEVSADSLAGNVPPTAMVNEEDSRTH